MFKENPEGQTHYYGDGCPEHNKPMCLSLNCPCHTGRECENAKRVIGSFKDWRNLYPLDTFSGETKEELVAFITKLLKAQKEELLAKLKNGELCANCGKEEELWMSGWCRECLDNE